MSEVDSFLTPLEVTPQDDGVNWRLLAVFEFLDTILGLIRCEIGLITDFASIPWLLRPIVGAAWGWYGKAAVGHDDLYKTQKFTRKQSDDCLLRMMRALLMVDLYLNAFARFFQLTYRRTQMYEIYSGVRIGGWYAWNQHAKQNAMEVKP